MNNTFNNLVIYNGYPLSIVAAIIFHMVVLAALLYLQNNSRTEVLNLVQPAVITALFIDENPQVRNERIIERQRLQRIEDQRLASERERQQQEEAQRQAEAERQRQQEQELAQQQERAALLEREQLERLREEQAQRDRDQQRQQREAEQQRQRELAEAERRQQQQQQERERQQAAAAEAARTELQLVQSATGLIQQVVQENWSRPPSARNGMRAVLQIRMLPTGELLEVIITQSSGDPAFDRSAETAVFRAAPFRELQSLPIKLFNTNFRSLSLIFEPEDLLN